MTTLLHAHLPTLLPSLPPSLLPSPPSQEEMDRFSGFWWSDDSSSLAYCEVDESSIPPYPITHQVGREGGREGGRGEGWSDEQLIGLL